MLLAIDVGNTRVKGAVFKQDILLGSFIFESDSIQKDILKILIHKK